MTEHLEITSGSGNVFADLGFDNPEEELLKAKLVREIRAALKLQGLTQAKAAVLAGLKQPDVSAILAGRTGKYSLDRLVRFLDRLGYGVEVTVKAKSRRATTFEAA